MNKMELIGIDELCGLNLLNEMCSAMLNAGVEKYDNYFDNDITYFYKNVDSITNDFENKLEDYKFYVLLDSKFLINKYGYRLLKFKDVEEFSKYMHIVPYKMLKVRAKNKINKMYEEYNSIEDEYHKMQYFLKNRRN